MFRVIIPILLALTTPTLQAQPEGSKPNIVVIYADDLGYGDLGCFGATDISTPHLDRLAKGGIKFTDFYAASPVCSPSRAALLTGRMPQRMGINGVFFPESFTGMPNSEVTLAEQLKMGGYATAMVGKWHLGHLYPYLPLQQGFDRYFGIPYSNDMESVVYMRGNELDSVTVNQAYITQTYTREALQFIEEQSANPFFLYLAHSMPHVPIYASPAFAGTSGRGLYGDVVEELDWSVGQVVEKLKSLGLWEKTLIIFSSDNGPWLVMQDHGGSAGPLREGKNSCFEGGQRVPTIAHWPQGIPAGQVYEEMAVMTDWFPTLSLLAGVPLPSGIPLDGADLGPVLRGRGNRQQTGFLYGKGGEFEGYRSGDWKIKLASEGVAGGKYVRGMAPHPLLLTNLRTDPGETVNLAEKEPEIVQKLLLEMQAHIQAMGVLPPGLVIRTPADASHWDYIFSKKE